MSFFDCFQLLSLAIFLFFFIGWSVALQQKGVRVFVISKGKSLKVRILEMFFVLFLLFWMLEIILMAIEKQSLIPKNEFLFESSQVQIIGAIVHVLALTIFIWALISFKQSWRIGIDEENPGDLITTGIFKYSRNPIFVFINMFFIGTALIYPSYFFIGLALAAIAGIHVQILNEEKHLKKLYGDKYNVYFNKVRRYF